MRGESSTENITHEESLRQAMSEQCCKNQESFWQSKKRPIREAVCEQWGVSLNSECFLENKEKSHENPRVVKITDFCDFSNGFSWKHQIHRNIPFSRTGSRIGFFLGYASTAQKRIQGLHLNDSLHQFHACTCCTHWPGTPLLAGLDASICWALP